jgi:hypothetical protein
MSSAQAGDWPPVSSNGQVQVSINNLGNELQRGKSEIHIKPSGVACSVQRGYGKIAIKIVNAPTSWEEKSKNSAAIGFSTEFKTGGFYVQSPYGTGWGTGSPLNEAGTGLFFKAGTWFSSDFWAVMDINTSGWPKGEYNVLAFYDNGCNGTIVGSLKFSLPDLASPSISCETDNVGQVIRLGDKIALTCTSDVELKNVLVSVEENSGIGWKELLGSIVSGKSFTVGNIPLSKQGGVSLRISSQGVQDQINSFSSNIIATKVSAPLEKLELKFAVNQYSATGNSQFKVTTGSSSVLVGQKFQVLSSISAGGPWTTEGSYKFSGANTIVNIKKPKGTWFVAKYTGDNKFGQAESNAVQLVEIPKVICKLPSSGKVNSKIVGFCTSSVSLLQTPITFLIDTGNGWEENGLGTLSGSKTPINLTPGSAGVIKMRLVSVGLIDNYGPFSSNTMVVNVTEPSSPSGTRDNSDKSIPKGKVDKTSNAYKVMYRVGQNFARVSLASETSLSQCGSALRTGFIKANGVPQYLGAQTRMLQSYLQTASGFQGCRDGFGH